MDPHKIEVGVGVHDEVAKPSGTGKPVGEMLGQNTVACQRAERIGVGRRYPQATADTDRRGDVDDDLNGLPEMQYHGVGHIGHGAEFGGLGGQSVLYPV